MSEVGIVEMNERIIVSVDDGGIPRSSHQPHISPIRERVLYKLFFSNPYFAAFSFLIMCLVGVVQATTQGNGASLFYTHPANLMAFITSTVIFRFALAAAETLPPDTSSSLSTRFVAFLSGALSVGSVVWMFLPRWLGWLFLIMWFLLLVMVGCDLFRHSSFQMLYQKTKEKLRDALSRLTRRNSTEQQHVPVPVPV